MAVSRRNIPSPTTNSSGGSRTSFQTNRISTVTQGAAESLRENINKPQEFLSDVQNTATSAIKDPFGTAIKTVTSKVNNLSVSIETKINDLVKDIAKKSDTKGRVSLEGNTFVITVTQEDVAQANQLQAKIQTRINSIRNTIVLLNNVLNSLLLIKTAIQTYKALLDLQEVLLTANPVTGPVFKVFKTAIKIVFLKEMIGEYLKILERNLLSNKRILNRLSNRFRSLQVSVKIQDESNKGNFIEQEEAEALLIQDLLDFGSEEELSADSQQFTDVNFNNYILKVEKYDNKQLIARAYEEYSGMIKAQTAPSYFSTPEQLFEEIKAIINSGV